MPLTTTYSSGVMAPYQHLRIGHVVSLTTLMETTKDVQTTTPMANGTTSRVLLKKTWLARKVKHFYYTLCFKDFHRAGKAILPIFEPRSLI